MPTHAAARGSQNRWMKSRNLIAITSKENRRKKPDKRMNAREGITKSAANLFLFRMPANIPAKPAAQGNNGHILSSLISSTKAAAKTAKARMRKGTRNFRVKTSLRVKACLTGFRLTVSIYKGCRLAKWKNRVLGSSPCELPFPRLSRS